MDEYSVSFIQLMSWFSTPRCTQAVQNSLHHEYFYTQVRHALGAEMFTQHSLCTILKTASPKNSGS